MADVILLQIKNKEKLYKIDDDDDILFMLNNNI